MTARKETTFSVGRMMKSPEGETSRPAEGLPGPLVPGHGTYRQAWGNPAVGKREGFC